MKKDSDYQTVINALAYVKRSKNRVKVIQIIGTSIKIPSEIAETMNLRINQISAILKDLKEEDIVVCINEEAKTGRLYQLTPMGLKIYNLLNKMEKE